MQPKEQELFLRKIGKRRDEIKNGVFSFEMKPFEIRTFKFI